MSKTVQLIIDGNTYELPLIVGTESEQAIDIRELRKNTGLITFDPGFVNTASCKSKITYLDGEQGILRYHGYPIEQLASQSSFVETAYLIINGELPSIPALRAFSELLNEHSMVHEDMRAFFENFPRGAHPMGILSSMVTALRFFYPALHDISDQEKVIITFARIISKLRTMAAMSYKISRGHKVVYPRHDLSFCANFLNMMFDTPVRPYILDDDVIRALNIFWILHADHEQNCSTTTVRTVGSAMANIYAAISAGISALWGPLHGGANQAVIEMLEQIYNGGGDPSPFVEKAKKKDNSFRLMGFGHRVYKNYDPRAKIIRESAHVLLNKLKKHDPLLDIAKQLEEIALSDQYFIDHNLYPNVDFYSGIILRAIGIPTNMFTVMFAIGRLPGWVSQWKESLDCMEAKIDRPRQIYIGTKERSYIPRSERLAPGTNEQFDEKHLLPWGPDRDFEWTS